MHFLSLVRMSILFLCIAHTAHAAESKTDKPKKKVAAGAPLKKILALEQRLRMQKTENLIAHNSQQHHLSDYLAVQLLDRHQDWSLPWAQEILQSGTLSSENAAKLLEHHARTRIIISGAPHGAFAIKK